MKSNYIKELKTTIVNGKPYRWTAIETTKTNKAARDEIDEYLKEHPEMHEYQMRHYDNDWSLPETIEKSVICNFFGYLIIDSVIDQLEKTDTTDNCIELSKDQGYDIIDAMID